MICRLLTRRKEVAVGCVYNDEYIMFHVSLMVQLEVVHQKLIFKFVLTEIDLYF